MRLRLLVPLAAVAVAVALLSALVRRPSLARISGARHAAALAVVASRASGPVRSIVCGTLDRIDDCSVVTTRAGSARCDAWWVSWVRDRPLRLRRLGTVDCARGAEGAGA